MPNQMTPSAPPTATTEETADYGCVLGMIGDYRQLLSHADAWHEEGVYIVRSTEFDVMAEHEDFDQALDKFVTWLFDYADRLAELVSAEKATDDEHTTFTTLSARLLPLAHEAERHREDQRHTQRRRRANIWRHQETPASSSGRLSAA